jgi:hypothetical protein
MSVDAGCQWSTSTTVRSSTSAIPTGRSYVSRWDDTWAWPAGRRKPRQCALFNRPRPPDRACHHIRSRPARPDPQRAGPGLAGQHHDHIPAPRRIFRRHHYSRYTRIAEGHDHRVPTHHHRRTSHPRRTGSRRPIWLGRFRRQRRNRRASSHTPRWPHQSAPASRPRQETSRQR